MDRPAVGLAGLSVFFAAGTVVAGVTGIALAMPGATWNGMWRLNPNAHDAFQMMGGWGILLMAVVAGACGCSAVGLWVRAPWGRRVAIGVLTLNLIGDASNAVFAHDLRTLIGIPIAALLIGFLLRDDVRRRFATVPSRR